MYFDPFYSRKYIFTTMRIFAELIKYKLFLSKKWGEVGQSGAEILKEYGKNVPIHYVSRHIFP